MGDNVGGTWNKVTLTGENVANLAAVIRKAEENSPYGAIDPAVKDKDLVLDLLFEFSENSDQRVTELADGGLVLDGESGGKMSDGHLTTILPHITSGTVTWKEQYTDRKFRWAWNDGVWTGHVGQDVYPTDSRLMFALERVREAKDASPEERNRALEEAFVAAVEVLDIDLEQLPRAVTVADLRDDAA